MPFLHWPEVEQELKSLATFLNADQHLVNEVAWAVLMFDQANTNGVIEKMGSRGVKLKNAVDDVRKLLTEKSVQHRTSDGAWSEGHGSTGT